MNQSWSDSADSSHLINDLLKINWFHIVAQFENRFF